MIEEEEKEVTTKDTSTGEEKKEIVKIPVKKNKVVRKAGVAIPATVAVDNVNEVKKEKK